MESSYQFTIIVLNFQFLQVYIFLSQASWAVLTIEYSHFTVHSCFLLVWLEFELGPLENGMFLLQNQGCS